MVKAKQLNLLKDPRKSTKLWWIQKHHLYGGSLNYRKVARPFDSKKLNHIVLKANLGAALGFNRFEKTVREIIRKSAARYGVQIKELAVHVNHLHILTYTKSRDSQTRFLRLLSAELGRRYKALRKRMGYSVRPLWSARPFTRLVGFGRRTLQNIKVYIRRNRYEALGFISTKPRRHRLNQFLSNWTDNLSAPDTA